MLGILGGMGLFVGVMYGIRGGGMLQNVDIGPIIVAWQFFAIWLGPPHLKQIYSLDGPEEF